MRPGRESGPRGRAPPRLGRDGHGLEGGRGPPRHRPRRREHAGRQPRRDRHRRGESRQSRSLREAPGQQRSPGRGDARGSTQGRRRQHGLPQLPPGARGDARQAAHRRWRARQDLPLQGHLPAGLDRRPAAPSPLALPEEARGIRGPRRHRRPLRGPGPVPGRRDHGSGRRPEDLHQAAAAPGQPAQEGARHGGRRCDRPRPLRERRHRDHRREPGRAGSEELQPLRNQREQGEPGLRPGEDERARALLHLGRPPRPGLPDDPGDGSAAPLRQGLVAAGPYPRLRAHLHPHDLRPAPGRWPEAAHPSRTSRTASGTRGSSAPGKRPPARDAGSASSSRTPARSRSRGAAGTRSWRRGSRAISPPPRGSG